MAQTEMVQEQAMSLGDSLRALADEVDMVPSLIMAEEVPEATRSLLVGLRTALAVEGYAELFGTPVERYDGGDGVHTSTELTRGRVALRLYHIGAPVRVLSRREGVTEELMERDA